MMAKMRVAIIGSGASGLTSIKCCLDEGFEPVCFEQEDYIGGMWNFTEDTTRTSSVYRSTVINTSKEMMCFSDFPMPKEFPPYMHNTFVVRYMDMYADRFDLKKHIRFLRKVVHVKKANDFEESGKWIVSSKASDEENGELVEEVFEAVMVCVGHHWQPFLPSFKGMDVFEGVQMHSHTYKDFKNFEGKTVVVVGIGNSGGDVAVELSRHAKQVYLSTRRGAWVLSRLSPQGKPLDMDTLTRLKSYVPLPIVNWALERSCNQRFCHKTFGLQPNHCLLGQHPMVNDGISTSIITGTLILKTNVCEFTRDSVIFEDGSVVEDLDAVIFCTGYNMRFPFLEIEKEILCENQVRLYKFVFPYFLKKPTLAVIGNVQPGGAINPISELQARWACGVFAKHLELPSEERMENDICMKKEQMKSRYYTSKRHTVQVDFIPYCDELAEMVGCKPNLWKLFLTDPLLSLRCLLGPCTPPQYRLMGPGTWDGAKKAIENAESNTIYATKTRVVKQKSSSSVVGIYKMLAIFVLMIAIVYKFCF